MKAVCWMGTSKVETLQRARILRLLNPHDAIIKVTRTAICGSDLHLFDGFIPTMEAGRHSRAMSSWESWRRVGRDVTT